MVLSYIFQVSLSGVALFLNQQMSRSFTWDNKYHPSFNDKSPLKIGGKNPIGSRTVFQHFQIFRGSKRFVWSYLVVPEFLFLGFAASPRFLQPALRVMSLLPATSIAAESDRGRSNALFAVIATPPHPKAQLYFLLFVLGHGLPEVLFFYFWLQFLKRVEYLIAGELRLCAFVRVVAEQGWLSGPTQSLGRQRHRRIQL